MRLALTGNSTVSVTHTQVEHFSEELRAVPVASEKDIEVNRRLSV